MRTETRLQPEKLSAAVAELQEQLGRLSANLPAPGESIRLEDVTLSHALTVVAMTGGNVAAAARSLGIARTTLIRMLKQAKETS